MTATIEKSRTSRAAISKARVPKKRTAPERTDDAFDITPERREELIAELRAFLEKAQEVERIESEKDAYLWEIPKEKRTAKERRLAIAALNASVKRGIGRRSNEAFLRELLNDRDR